MFEKMQNAKLDLPKPQVGAQHPFRSAENHRLLLTYLQQRLRAGTQSRDTRMPRMVQIDKDVAGWQRLSEEDKKRQREHEINGTPLATAMTLPLNWVHLDDMMTYYAQTFSPNRGMFYHSAPPGDAAPSSQIVTLMNNHAVYSGYYVQLLRAIYSILKYNNGGLLAFWSSDMAPKFGQDLQGNTVVNQEVVWQGNKTEALDMYNTVWDDSLPAQNVYKDGEYAARFMIKSHYWLNNKASEGVYYNCDRALAEDVGFQHTTYYRYPPSEARLAQDESSQGSTNWAAVFAQNSGYTRENGFELAEVYIRLNPVEFGLVDGAKAETRKRNRYEIWRFTILNDEEIIEATYMNNVHGYIPYFFASINDDNMEEHAKSPSEILQPLQNFASALLNIHILGSRRNLYGTTYYDPTMVNVGGIPKGEVAANVPINPAAYGKDIRTFLYRENGAVDTKQTLQDLEAVMGLIDQFFPTQSLPSQIAGIDRAVDSQVAAVQQGSNRRQHKGARLLDDVMFRPFRFALYYNIIQYQQDGAMVADFYGKPIKVDLTALRETDLPFIIGQGLKAIDRQAAAALLKDLLFALIQNPQAAQQVDIMGLFDYWTSMLDIDIDFRQFQREVPAAPVDSGIPGAEAIASPGAVQPAAPVV